MQDAFGGGTNHYVGYGVPAKLAKFGSEFKALRLGMREITNINLICTFLEWSQLR